jgi:alcohol dehydrogenase class IV
MVVNVSFTAPKRTVFGRGSRDQAPDLISELGRRVLIVRGRSVPWVETCIQDLISRDLVVETVMANDEPDLDILRRLREQARSFDADIVVAIGGGSVIDLGKALSGLIPSEGDPSEYIELGVQSPKTLSEPLPFVAIATTSGTGAEATRNAVIGVPEQNAKISMRDPRLLPSLVIVDPALTDHSSKSVTLASGLDAITQLIESYVSIRATPLTDAIARDTIPRAIKALNALMESEGKDARDVMSQASYLSGLVLANSGLGIVHGLASIIGGFGAPHGAVCGRLLAPALEINTQALLRAKKDVSKFEEIERWLAFGLQTEATSGFAKLKKFVDANALPRLRDHGISTADYTDIAKRSQKASSTQANPVQLELQDIIAILEQSDADPKCG